MQSHRDPVWARDILPLPGVLPWPNALHAAGWRQAVASSAPRLNLDLMLGTLLPP